MTTDPLRTRIAAYLANAHYDVRNDQRADAILALVREHATSDAAVEAAIKAINARAIWPRKRDMQAAITAALGGGHG